MMEVKNLNAESAAPPPLVEISSSNGEGGRARYQGVWKSTAPVGGTHSVTNAPHRNRRKKIWNVS